MCASCHAPTHSRWPPRGPRQQQQAPSAPSRAPPLLCSPPLAGGLVHCRLRAALGPVRPHPAVCRIAPTHRSPRGRSLSAAAGAGRRRGTGSASPPPAAARSCGPPPPQPVAAPGTRAAHGRWWTRRGRRRTPHARRQRATRRTAAAAGGVAHSPLHGGGGLPSVSRRCRRDAGGGPPRRGGGDGGGGGGGDDGGGGGGGSGARRRSSIDVAGVGPRGAVRRVFWRHATAGGCGRWQGSGGRSLLALPHHVDGSRPYHRRLGGAGAAGGWRRQHLQRA